MAEIIYAMIDLMFSPCSFYKQYFYILREVVWKKFYAQWLGWGMTRDKVSGE